METDRFNSLCLKYSVPAFFLGLTSAILIAFTQSAPGLFWADFVLIYLVSSMAVALLVFAARTSTRGMGETTNLFELSVMALSGLGFSLPIAILGLFLAGIGETDYEGAERWLGEIESPEEEVQRIVAELDLSEKVYHRSIQLLETAADHGLIKGRPISEVVPAIVYIAAREENDPRTLEDISQVSRASKKEIGKSYRYIGRNTEFSIRPPDPVDYVGLFADRMGLSQNVVDSATLFVEQAEEESITSGKSPGGIAASALYLAAYIEGEKRTMKDIARTLSITSATIRNRSRDLIKALDLEDYPEHFEGKIE